MAALKIDELPVSTEVDLENHRGNRRKEPRVRLASGLIVHISLPPAEDTVEAELNNVTHEGVGFVTEIRFARGTIITFRCANQRVYARVEYCRGCASGYQVGAHINDVVDEAV